MRVVGQIWGFFTAKSQRTLRFSLFSFALLVSVVSLLSVVGEFTAGGVEGERRNGDSGAPGEWPSAWAAPESPFRGHRRKEPPFLSNNTRQGDLPRSKVSDKALRGAITLLLP